MQPYGGADRGPVREIPQMQAGRASPWSGGGGRGERATDDRIDECIKWKSPTFTFEGNIASFNPRSKKHASLMFHTGAEIPGDHPSLDGGGDTARYMTFADIADVEAKADDLRDVLRAWIDWKGG